MAHCVAQQRVYQSGQPLSSRSPPPSGRGTTPVYTSPQRARVASPVPRRVGPHQVHPQVGQQQQQPPSPQAQVRAQAQGIPARPVSPGRSPHRQHSAQQPQHLPHQQPQQRMHHSGPAAIHVQQAAPQQPQRRPPSADLPSIGQQVRMLMDHLNGVGGCLASVSRTLAQLVDPSLIDPKSGINATLWAELQQLHAVGEDICQKAAGATHIIGTHLSTVQSLSLPANTGPSAWGLLGVEDLSATVSALASALSHPKLREGALGLPDLEIAALSLSGSSSASALGQSNRPSPVGILGEVSGLLVDSGAQTDPIISIRPTPNPAPAAGQPAAPAVPHRGALPTPGPATPTPNPNPAHPGASAGKPPHQGPPVSVPSTVKAATPNAPAVVPVAPVAAPVAPVVRPVAPTPPVAPVAPPTPPTPPPAQAGRAGGPPPPPPLPPVNKKPHTSPVAVSAKPRAATPPPQAQKPRGPTGPSLMDELSAKINNLKAPGSGAKAKSVSPPPRRPSPTPDAPADEKQQIHAMLAKKFVNVNRGSIESQASEWSV